MTLELLEEGNGLRIFDPHSKYFGYRCYIVEQKPAYHEILWNKGSKLDYADRAGGSYYAAVTKRRTFRVPLPHMIYGMFESFYAGTRKKQLSICAIATRRSKIASKKSRVSYVPLPNMYEFRPCGHASSNSFNPKETPIMHPVNQAISAYWNGPASTDGTWHKPAFWKKEIKSKNNINNASIKGLEAWEKMTLKEVLSFPWPLTSTTVESLIHSV